MSSVVTGKVESCPCTTMPRESPIRIRSTPLASKLRAKPASYAVNITSFCPVRLASANAGTVQGLLSAWVLMS